jgi:choline transport protein
MPFPSFFSRIHPKLDFPMHTTLAAILFNCVYGLLYLASTTAFNSIVTSAVLFLNLSYAIPLAVVAVRGRDKVLPVRAFNLGKSGYLLNIFAPLWVTLLGIMACFPPTIPVSLGTMNFSSVVLIGIFLIFIIFWFTIGKNFRGPKINIQAMSEVNALEKK